MQLFLIDIYSSFKYENNKKCHIFIYSEYIIKSKKRGGFYMSQMNNMDMGKLMEMLSKMDKKQLEQGLSKVSQFLSNEDKAKIMNELNKKSN